MENEKSKFDIKRDFLYGLIMILPIITTIWLVKFSVGLMSGPAIAIFGKNFPPIASFALTLIFITGIGILARNIIGRAVLNYVEHLMSRIPIINIIYKSVKQIVNAFSFQDKMLSAVMVEYPRKGMWALGFLTNENPSGVMSKSGEDKVEGMVSVFIPTTPNPTSGYFLYLNKSEVVELDTSIEDSVKLLMSAGVLAGSKAVKKSKPKKAEA